MKRSLSALLVFVCSLFFSVPGFASVLLVHLPSTPTENASRLAGAVTALNEHLQSKVPTLDLEIQIFRRYSDVEAFLETRNEDVVLLLSESSLLLDLAPDAGLVPAYQFQRAGSQTYHRLLVIKSARAETRLSQLQGASLAVIETAQGGGLPFLAAAAFYGKIDPALWFGEVEAVADDFVAVANVLYDKVDAAFPAEHNPLLQQQLGNELRWIYRSGPLPLPVISLRESALTTQQRDAIRQALESLAGETKILEELQIDAIATLTSETQSSLLRLPQPIAKRPEAVVPDIATARLVVDALPSSSELPASSDLLWTLDLDLPEISTQENP